MEHVSVIIPAYNAEPFIRRSIESVLAQAPHVKEVIVVDDGSTDATRDVVKSFGGIVALLGLPHSGNASFARNRGIEVAGSDLIAFLDADDVFLPGKIELQLGMMRADRSLGFSSTNAYRQIRPEQSNGMDRLIGSASVPHEADALDTLILDNYVIMSSVLARRSALEDAALFSEATELRLVADYDMWLRIAAARPFSYVDKPLLVYRDWGVSYRDETSAIDTNRAIKSVFDRLDTAFPAVRHQHGAAVSRRRDQLNREIVLGYLSLGDQKHALVAASESVLEAPTRLLAWKSLGRAILR